MENFNILYLFNYKCFLFLSSLTSFYGSEGLQNQVRACSSSTKYISFFLSFIKNRLCSIKIQHLNISEYIFGSFVKHLIDSVQQLSVGPHKLKVLVIVHKPALTVEEKY